jgi:hypothetical protein
MAAYGRWPGFLQSGDWRGGSGVPAAHHRPASVGKDALSKVHAPFCPVSERPSFPVPGCRFPIPDSRPSAALCRFGSFLAPRPSSLGLPAWAGSRHDVISVPCSPFPVPAFIALRTRNSFSRLGLQKQVSPGFRFSAPLLLIVYLSTASKVIHNGVWPCVHVKNRQIRVKIDQKGDVFRQKTIKKARVSSCPS